MRCIEHHIVNSDVGTAESNYTGMMIKTNYLQNNKDQTDL